MQTRLSGLALLIAAACAAPAPPTPDSSPADTAAPIAVPRRTPPTGDQSWDQAVIDQLGRDARSLANAEKCTDVGECRVAPLGVKACGGPREYVVYCAATTDTVALFRKLEELARAERAFNERYGIASTCDFRAEPTVALVGQRCSAVP